MMQEAHAASNQYYGRVPGESDFAQLPMNIRPQIWDEQTGGWVANPRFNPALLQRQTDWERVPLNPNAPITNHNLSVSGATEQVNYFVSAGYFQQDAIQHKWDLNRLSFRANSDFTINERIRFGETFSLSNQFTLRGHHNWGDGRILPNALVMAPIAVFRDPACETPAGCPNNRYGFASNQDVFDGGLANHAAINHIIDVEDRNTRMIGGLHGEIDVLRGLTFRSQGNLDYRISRFYQWNPGYAQHEMGLDRNVPRAEESRQETYGIVFTNTLTYDGAIGNHNVNLLGGVETQQTRWNAIGLYRNEFLSFDENVRRIVGGSGATPASAWAGENAFLGYLGRLTYNFGDRYLLTASVRRDGASEFAPGYQWGTFPAVSAAWRVSQEPAFNVPWINELKIRGSWGRMGNSAIPGGAYPHLLSIAPNSTYTLNGTGWTGDVPIPLPRFPNPALTWETTTTSDFGFLGAVLDNSVDFSATYYDKSTGGFLLPIDLPPSSGFNQSPFNSGRVTNRGVELELGYNAPRLLGEVDLRVSGNLTTVRNRLEELAPDMEQYAAPGDGGVQAFAQQYRTAPGFPIGYFYGFQTCGIFQTNEAAAQAPVDRTIDGRRREAGDMCFVDVNGDGEITVADRTFIGSSIPDGYFGLNMTAAFRQFDLTTFFSGAYGVQKYNQVRQRLEHLGGGTGNQRADVLNRWTPENPNASMPRAIAGDPAGNNRFSDRWVEDAGFVRLRTLQLGYTLPQGFLGTNNTRIYLSGQNVFTLTGYSGYDPEFTTSIDNWRSRNDLALFQGTDTGDIPQPRIWQIGVRTTF
jgi:TonB-dependent starch-binding outer membrane protein SusC